VPGAFMQGSPVEGPAGLAGCCKYMICWLRADELRSSQEPWQAGSRLMFLTVLGRLREAKAANAANQRVSSSDATCQERGCFRMIEGTEVF
jgi:hypothetical protein